jgi:NADH-quinone oxidoreductase subunit N
MHLAQGLIQADVDWHALAPELVMIATACIVLVVDLFLPREDKWIAMPLSAAGLFGTLAAVASLIGDDRTTLAASFEVNEFALLFKGLFAVIGLVVLGISFNFFREGRYYQGEYYFLLLCGLLGGMVMASSRDLVSIFIAIELISIPGIIMTALRKGDAKSNESALKFFLFSVLSSAVMLYGMSLIYGVTGATQLDAIRTALETVGSQPIVTMSVFFIVVGFAFKISAVPFHFWAPDTYEGAPSPVAAFLSTASKIGGFVGLLVLMFVAFPSVADDWRPIFAALAVLTMTVGNLIALRQTHIIRLLAYSGIAQSGYVLVAFALIDPGNASSNSQAFQSALIYLAIYGIMDVGAFAAAVAFARRGGSYFISDYKGLWGRSPLLACMLTAFLVSLAGVPPLAGAWAKLFIFLAAVKVQLWLAVVMGVNAVIAAWYYLAVVKRMFFDTAEEESAVEVPHMLRVSMGFCAAVLLILLPGLPLLTNLVERSTL